MSFWGNSGGQMGLGNYIPVPPQIPPPLQNPIQGDPYGIPYWLSKQQAAPPPAQAPPSFILAKMSPFVRDFYEGVKSRRADLAVADEDMEGESLEMSCLQCTPCGIFNDGVLSVERVVVQMVRNDFRHFGGSIGVWLGSCEKCGLWYWSCPIWDQLRMEVQRDHHQEQVKALALQQASSPNYQSALLDQLNMQARMNQKSMMDLSGMQNQYGMRP